MCDARLAAPRQVPNSAYFQQLQQVKNMRDLAEVCPSIAPGDTRITLIFLLNNQAGKISGMHL